MKVKFRTNLGSRDAVLYELDHTKCVIGAEMEVSKETGEALIARGLCEPSAKSKSVKAVPPKAQVRGVPEGEKFLKDYKEQETSGD